VASLTRPCPFCGATERQEHGGRSAAGCPGCGSLERHRALLLCLDGELEPRASGRCLELGPRSAQVYGGYLVSRGWEYTGTDRWAIRRTSDPEAFGYFIHHDADATDLMFAPSAGYELFIAQHVIEQLDDYAAGLDEAARVLEPGGRALLEIPWAPDKPESTRGSRDRHGRVWSFGQDLLQSLEKRFSSVDLVSLAEGEYQGSVFVCSR
jgi:SAM-dependent methyltransferase